MNVALVSCSCLIDVHVVDLVDPHYEGVPEKKRQQTEHCLRYQIQAANESHQVNQTNGCDEIRQARGTNTITTGKRKSETTKHAHTHTHTRKHIDTHTHTYTHLHPDTLTETQDTNTDARAHTRSSLTRRTSICGAVTSRDDVVIQQYYCKVRYGTVQYSTVRYDARSRTSCGCRSSLT